MKTKEIINQLRVLESQHIKNPSSTFNVDWSAKRDQAYDNAVVCSEADFESVWEAGLSDYLSAGGQAIIDERTAKWEQFFGSSDMLP